MPLALLAAALSCSSTPRSSPTVPVTGALPTTRAQALVPPEDGTWRMAPKDSANTRFSALD